MGPLSSKNYSLTTLGEKKRRIRELSVTNCSLVVFLCFFRSKLNHFMYIFVLVCCKSDCCILQIINQNRCCRYKIDYYPLVHNVFQLSKITQLTRQCESLISLRHILETKTCENPAVIIKKRFTHMYLKSLVQVKFSQRAGHARCYWKKTVVSHLKQL